MIQVSTEVIANRQILPGFKHPARTVLGSQLIWLRCPPIAREGKPGQFVMVRCGKDLVLPRPLSIHQINNDGNMALLFTVWADGKGTRWLSQRKAGDKIDLFGPLGNGYHVHSTSRNLLLVAGGIGIASLYFLAQESLKNERSVTLLQGAQTANQLYPENLLPSGIKLYTTTDDGSAGDKGRVTRLLPDFAGWADQIFACGPRAMYRDMKCQKQELKLQGTSLQVSMEMRMGCGLGVCYGCTVKTDKGLKQACKDGPVFDLDDILEDELSPIST